MKAKVYPIAKVFCAAEKSARILLEVRETKGKVSVAGTGNEIKAVLASYKPGVRLSLPVQHRFRPARLFLLCLSLCVMWQISTLSHKDQNEIS
jgi:hypothetical protein